MRDVQLAATPACRAKAQRWRGERVTSDRRWLETGEVCTGTESVHDQSEHIERRPHSASIAHFVRWLSCTRSDRSVATCFILSRAAFHCGSAIAWPVRLTEARFECVTSV